MMSVILSSLFMLSAFGGEAEFLELRESFKSASFIAAPHLKGTKWNCENIQAFSDFSSLEKELFEFQEVPHNSYMLYSRLNSPAKWFPHWFSTLHEGLQSTVSFKTNDFISECEGHFLNCTESGDSLSNKVYVRVLEPSKNLVIEWTTLDHDKLNLEALSFDRNIEKQKVFMYSLCNQI